MKGHPPISPIYRQGPCDHDHSDRREALRYQAFREHGVVVIHLDDDRLDDFERQYALNIGRKLTGATA